MLLLFLIFYSFRFTKLSRYFSHVLPVESTNTLILFEFLIFTLVFDNYLIYSVQAYTAVKALCFQAFVILEAFA